MGKSPLLALQKRIKVVCVVVGLRLEHVVITAIPNVNLVEG
tara:strand:- start:1426 stop:1548 length:123 start_codon:yes stop_codon:yes gene_type:complete